MKANMHLHSRFSDGSAWPREIACDAAGRGLEAIALTDHDSLSGASELLESAKEYGIQAWAGVEIDCNDRIFPYKSEFLAYFPNGSFASTVTLLEGVKRSRKERFVTALERARSIFNKPGLSFDDFFSVKTASRSGTISPGDFSFNKYDFFRYMRLRNAIPKGTAFRAFRKAYFETGMLGNGKNTHPDAATIAKAVRDDGGFLVLPHPGHEFDDDPGLMASKAEKLERLFSWFGEQGGEGIELYHYKDADSERINDMLKRLAERLGFFLTYGSDCHGPESDRYTLGDYSGDFAGFPTRG